MSDEDFNSFDGGDGDTFTEVEDESWGSRIVGSLGKVVMGILLFLTGFPVLFLNEGRAVKTAKSLAEGASSVISVSVDKTAPENMGKLVHISGKAVTDEPIKDDLFGISTPGALKIKRTVEMYQWQEKVSTKTRKKLGGGRRKIKTYSYHKKWSSSAIDSSHFKKANHNNPGPLPYKSKTFSAKKVALLPSGATGKSIPANAFLLSPALIGQINSFSALRLDNAAYAQLPSSIKDSFRLLDGQLYRGRSSSQPAIGDLRVSFEKVEPQTVSIVAKQTPEGLQSYKTSVGGTIEELALGQVSADKMFQAMQKRNTIFTWILRLAGFLLMLFGLSCIFSPLAVLADVIPFLGDLLRLGTGLVALVISAPLALITISVAWIFYRPLLGVGLLVGALVILGTGFALAKSRSGNAVKER